jgi:predicted CDP-diglyceride synthetase/phosphatidate cytidylyltransferase
MNPTKKPTKKVAAAGISAGAVVVAVAILSAVTPDMLTALGPFEPLALAAVVALAGFLGGYIKKS